MPAVHENYDSDSKIGGPSSSGSTSSTTTSTGGSSTPTSGIAGVHHHAHPGQRIHTRPRRLSLDTHHAVAHTQAVPRSHQQPPHVQGHAHTHGPSGIQPRSQRRSASDLIPLNTKVSSVLQDEGRTGVSSPTGSFTSALSPVAHDEGHPRTDLAGIVRRHHTAAVADEPKSYRRLSTSSSVPPHSPAPHPSQPTVPADPSSHAGSSADSPTARRHIASGNTSWFSASTHTKPSKSDDGLGTDSSDNDDAQPRASTSARSRPKRRLAEGVPFLSATLQTDRHVVDPNHILPLSASPSFHDESSEVTGSSPRTSMSSGWGTRSFSSSSGAEDDGSPMSPAYRLPIDPYSAVLRPPRGWSSSQSWWPPQDLLTRLFLSNNSLPTHEYLRHRRQSRSQHLDKRSVVFSQRGRKYRHPWSQLLRYAVDLVVSEPWKLVLFLVFLLIFGVCLGCTIKYNLDPDNMALPWREYCTSNQPTLYHLPANVAQPARSLPPLNPLVPITERHRLWPYGAHAQTPFSADVNGSRVDTEPPATVFLAVFTYDRGRSRRDVIRKTYMMHPRSRTPGTEGVRVRFMMGRPDPELAADIKAEQDEFGDIVFLDIKENMNSGKTHAYISWAAEHARVPDCEYPSHPRSPESAAAFAEAAARGETPAPICRGEKAPDFIAKADDDTFLMLGEFERHLRAVPKTKAIWGYLVRDLFMAGECYAMTRDLAQWIRTNGMLADYTHGKEDKLVARWLRMHPQATDIVWATERCWIYDHPRGGTVYSHGFLFPSEVASVRDEQQRGVTAEVQEQRSKYARNPDAYSSVTRFGARYLPPVRGLAPSEEVEALVEGSGLSKLRELPGGRPYRATIAAKVEELYGARPSMGERYLSAEGGGTVIVHYNKKDSWFMESAAALLGDGEFVV